VSLESSPGRRELVGVTWHGAGRWALVKNQEHGDGNNRNRRHG
jgi:hypothetical protein